MQSLPTKYGWLIWSMYGLIACIDIYIKKINQQIVYIYIGKYTIHGHYGCEYFLNFRTFFVSVVKMSFDTIMFCWDVANLHGFPVPRRRSSKMRFMLPCLLWKEDLRTCCESLGRQVYGCSANLESPSSRPFGGIDFRPPWRNIGIHEDYREQLGVFVSHVIVKVYKLGLVF